MKKDPSLSECVKNLEYVDDALYVIAGKWKLKVVIALKEYGNQRFNELQRNLIGISPKVLSNELKDLEQNNLLVRREFVVGGVVAVEYQMTEYCESLREIIKALADWGLNHRQMLIELKR